VPKPLPTPKQKLSWPFIKKPVHNAFADSIGKDTRSPGAKAMDTHAWRMPDQVKFIHTIGDDGEPQITPVKKP
jgi:hypothetical protein